MMFWGYIWDALGLAVIFRHWSLNSDFVIGCFYFRNRRNKYNRKHMTGGGRSLKNGFSKIKFPGLLWNPSIISHFFALVEIIRIGTLVVGLCFKITWKQKNPKICTNLRINFFIWEFMHIFYFFFCAFLFALKLL